MMMSWSLRALEAQDLLKICGFEICSLLQQVMKRVMTFGFGRTDGVSVPRAHNSRGSGEKAL